MRFSLRDVLLVLVLVACAAAVISRLLYSRRINARSADIVSELEATYGIAAADGALLSALQRDVASTRELVNQQRELVDHLKLTFRQAARDRRLVPDEKQLSILRMPQIDGPLRLVRAYVIHVPEGIKASLMLDFTADQDSPLAMTVDYSDQVSIPANLRDGYNFVRVFCDLGTEQTPGHFMLLVNGRLEFSHHEIVGADEGYQLQDGIWNDQQDRSPDQPQLVLLRYRPEHLSTEIAVRLQVTEDE